MKIITLEQIKEILPKIDLITEIEQGFIAYSNKRAVVPPVGELLLEKGEVHIKYGYIKNDNYYVIKIASGFYANAKYEISSSNGLMLLYEQETGELASILLDEGHLTDVRTAIAGAIAAKYLAPKNVKRIGIVGTGIQARLQLKYLKEVTACRQVLVWGRSVEKLCDYKTDMESYGFEIEMTDDAKNILQRCNLVVTTTPSEKPILCVTDLQKETHITAVGSDTSHKQELDSDILGKADLVVADSISQCLVRGEIFKAISNNKISQKNLIELGDIISNKQVGRTSDEQITITDLTGVAVQDIQIAKCVYNSFSQT